MWVHNSALAKTIVCPHKIKVENSSQIISYKNIQNYCRNNRKFTTFVILHNKIQTVRISHQISQKFGISSKCHVNCSSNKCKLLLHKTSRAAINCSYVYCGKDYGKCYKHAPLSSNTLLYSLVLKRQPISPGTNIKQINYIRRLITTHISQWLILLAQKAAFPLIYSTCHRSQT